MRAHSRHTAWIAYTGATEDLATLAAIGRDWSLFEMEPGEWAERQVYRLIALPGPGDRMGPVEIEMEELADEIEYDQESPGAHDLAAAEGSLYGPPAKRGRQESAHEVSAGGP